MKTKKFYAINAEEWDVDSNGEIPFLTDEQFKSNAELTFESPEELCEFLNETEALTYFFRYA